MKERMAMVLITTGRRMECQLMLMFAMLQEHRPSLPAELLVMSHQEVAAQENEGLGFLQEGVVEVLLQGT
jgi:hypothetical protein